MIITHISSHVTPGDKSFLAFKSMFTQLGIQVAHAGSDEPLFYEASQTSTWDTYHSQLARYEAISHSAFHIIYNPGGLSEEVVSEMLYAMIKKRPIILTYPLTFSRTVSPFMRTLITRHKAEFYFVTMNDFDLTELSKLLARCKTTPNYHLTKSEIYLIKNRLKIYFSTLLSQAKENSA